MSIVVRFSPTSIVNHGRKPTPHGPAGAATLPEPSRRGPAAGPKARDQLSSMSAGRGLVAISLSRRR
jgi:hypothetical protein